MPLQSSPLTLTPRVTATFLLASILPLLDSSLVNVLLPAIGADLNVPQRTVQLGVSAYMLAGAAGIVLSTTTNRKYGARAVFLGSVIFFGLASAGVGASTSLAMFVTMRTVQGLACGFIMPSVQALAAAIVGRDGMRSALATIGLPAVVAPAFGPLVGGVLVDSLGWRVLFYVNIPVVLLALLLSSRALPKTPSRDVPLGLMQALPAVIGLVGLLWAITSVSFQDESTVIVVGIGSLLLIGIFCYFDLKAATPVLDMSLYSAPAFSGVMVLCLLVGGVFYGTLLATSLHIQMGMQQPAFIAGIILGIQGVGAWVARRQIKQRWSTTSPFGLICVGLLLAAVATIGMQTVTAWSVGTAFFSVFCAAVRGLGLGVCTLLALSAAYEVVEEKHAAAVGAHTRLMIQLGGALGAAVVGVWHGTAFSLGGLVSVIALCGAVCAFVLGKKEKRQEAH